MGVNDGVNMHAKVVTSNVTSCRMSATRYQPSDVRSHSLSALPVVGSPVTCWLLERACET